MSYSFHPSARIEFLEAIAHYEGFREGLGLDFSREVFLSINRIVQLPFAWTAFSEGTRRCLTNRFPYGVIYQFTDGEILIVAIAQLNREPGYWEGRIK